MSNEVWSMRCVFPSERPWHTAVLLTVSAQQHGGNGRTSRKVMPALWHGT